MSAPRTLLTIVSLIAVVGGLFCIGTFDTGIPDDAGTRFALVESAAGETADPSSGEETAAPNRDKPCSLPVPSIGGAIRPAAANDAFADPGSPGLLCRLNL